MINIIIDPTKIVITMINVITQYFLDQCNHTYLEITVHDAEFVEVFDGQNDLSAIEPGAVFGEHPLT